jgi:predicted nucleotide-binding protein (sugar kinase/HSP70/actin superfamily)
VNLSVPHCGSIQFMARDICERLGLGYVEAPAYSERTVEIGIAISPEHICFPCKVLLGSAVEALELGADTLITAAGFGPCRFNYFAEIERRILEREGYSFRIITFDGPGDDPLEFYRNLRIIMLEARKGPAGVIRQGALTLRKGWAYDEIEKSAMAIRALEAREGAVDRAVDECRAMLAAAYSKKEIEEACLAIKERFNNVPVESGRPHLRVGLVGELMMSLEPYFNFDVARWLAKNGAVVERSVHMSDVFTPFRRNPVFGYTAEEIERAASPYLCHEIGGHGHLSVGATVIFAQRGFDAIVHFFPFTCLPEVIAKTIFVRVSGELDIPILSISVDEQTGRAGMQTRLEALVDLAWSNKRNSLKGQVLSHA